MTAISTHFNNNFNYQQIQLFNQKKQASCCLQETHFALKIGTALEMDKSTSNEIKKQAGVTILMSDKTDLN